MSLLVDPRDQIGHAPGVEQRAWKTAPLYILAHFFTVFAQVMKRLRVDSSFEFFARSLATRGDRGRTYFRTRHITDIAAITG